LDGFAIETPLGDSLGKLTSLILDVEKWKVSKLVVSPGALKKQVTYDLGDISEFKKDDKKIVIKPDIEPGQMPEFPTLTFMPLKELMGKKILTSDEEKLRGLYDLDIATQLKEWDVWKLLIQTPLKERRLRLSHEDVEAVAENIVLKLSMDDIETREKETE
jgi:sporulation protein YlmC with PRC-barrel domain